MFISKLFVCKPVLDGLIRYLQKIIRQQRMWSTIRQEWAKRDIFELGPEGELTELALLRSLTCRVRRMKSFICQSWATDCVFVGYDF